jgi:amidase
LPDLAAQQGVFLGLLGAAYVARRTGRDADQRTRVDESAGRPGRFRRQWVELFQQLRRGSRANVRRHGVPARRQPDQQARTHLIDGQPTPTWPRSAGQGVALLPNLPATACPIGFSRAGLPISAQVIGPYLEDRTTIAFAGLLEREFGGFKRPPGY